MKILTATQTYDLRASGAGLFTVRLAEALAAGGHEVTVVTPSDGLRARSAEQRGVRVELVPALVMKPLAPEVRIPVKPNGGVERLFDRVGPDVVHVQDHYTLGRVVLDLACRRGIPVLATNHFLPENVIPYLPVPSWSRPTFARLLWRWVACTYARASVVTTPSRAGAEAMRDAGLPLPALAVSCGVDTELFRPLPEVDRAAVRRELGLDPEAVTVLFAGRLYREKRVDVLLRGLAALDHAGPLAGPPGADPTPRTVSIQLIVTGTGREEGHWRRLAARLGLERRVVFTGYVRRQRLLELLNASDIFAMPSDAELLSIATLEAMAVGLPILAADARALPELVSPGANGELFRPGSVQDAAAQLRRLVERRDRWPAMAEESRRRARQHAFGLVVARYEAILRDLVDVSGEHPTRGSSAETPPAKGAGDG
jgi:1,2-diacylglycerol 3-alpha-glucosyltransferase